MQDDSINDYATLVNRWADGPCYTVTVTDYTAYFGNEGYPEIVNILNPANPIIPSRVLTSSVVRDIAINRVL